jgi:hypothetical protein
MSLAIDIFVFLLLGLLGLEVIRRLVHRFAPAVKPIYFDLIYFLVLLLGAYLFFPKAIAEKELREAQNRTEKALRNNQDELKNTKDELTKTQEELAKAQKKLNEEQQARLEIQRGLAKRLLSSKEEKIIAEALRPYPGHEIKIKGIGNPESELYADQFAKLLETSKWKVEKIHGALMGPAQYGILLVISEKPDQAVQSLMSALKKAGIKFKSRIDQRLAPEGVSLLVGDKDPTEIPSTQTP